METKMATSQRATKEELAPDQRPLTSIQAKRIGALADIDASDLEKVTIAKVSDKLKWKIDPNLFLFRRICGKVVKKDPITGDEYPVPFATVYVEDTDCNLISYFPSDQTLGLALPILLPSRSDRDDEDRQVRQLLRLGSAVRHRLDFEVEEGAHLLPDHLRATVDRRLHSKTAP